MFMALNLVVGFLLGALAIIGIEALCVVFLWKRLLKKSNKNILHSNSTQLDHQQSVAFASNKQGTVWALGLDKVPRLLSEDKALKDQSSKKESLEVSPVKKHAKIDGQSLILTDSDGSQVAINLLGCSILAVSATNLSSRKWAKRYPIKLESRNVAIYMGSKTCYLYFETSWEKESWCKALRLASCVNKERINWHAKLSKDFHDYLTSLKAGYPSFMKPSTGFFCDPTDKAIRTDGSSSKVRLFLKKLAKKASKSGLETKAGGMSYPVSEERRTSEKSRSVQDIYATGSTKTISAEKTANNSLGENSMVPSLNNSGNQGQVSVISDADSDEKNSIDEGTLCWNLLISRLFFDAKRNANMKSSIQARIQRSLSTMRTPSYIGGVTCTSLDVGILPPYIHSMRVLPTEMNEVWAMEIDIEYSGGAILDIETRLEVREAEFEKGLVNASIDSSSAEEVTSDLLEGLEHFGNQLKLSGEMVDETGKRDEGDNKFDGIKKSNSWKSSYMSRWKCILNSIANQVSQVPISLAIKVASVKGTLRLHIKPPPSDQLWFGFTSMPDIDFNLESCLGDHRISSAHVALLLGNRIKAGIRDTLVLPNCEGVCIPWMLAEKDDWVPRNIAPFSWINNPMTSSNDPVVGATKPAAAGDVKTNKKQEEKKQPPMLLAKKSVEAAEEEEEEEEEQGGGDLGVSSSSSLSAGVSLSRSNTSSTDNPSLQDLKTPLLITARSYDPASRSSSETQFDTTSTSTSGSEAAAPSRSVTFSGRDRHIPPANGTEDAKRVGGRKARMLDLGKKMGEKLEEKRRHIEEKSRNIVDKMRATTTTTGQP